MIDSSYLFDAIVEMNKVILFETGGGSHNIIKKNELLSACNRPFTVVFGMVAFDSPIKKACVICQSIVQAHGFENGNKRTALMAMEWFLNENNIHLILTENQKYQFIHDVESGDMELEDMFNFITHFHKNNH